MPFTISVYAFNGRTKIMAKDVKFNIRLAVDGKEQVTQMKHL
jgi:hypothetical protein